MSNPIYQEFERCQNIVSDRLKGDLLKERILYTDMADLMLQATIPVSDYHENDANGDPAILLAVSRMFNSFEGAKELLLSGLPSQALLVLRDTIECMLLVRLFLIEPQAARNWVGKFAQYEAGTISTTLKDKGIDALEYSFYGLFSDLSHANVPASLSNVEEEEIGGGSSVFRRYYYFGGCGTRQGEEFAQAYFVFLFFLMCLALAEPLAQVYARFSARPDSWLERVQEVYPRIGILASEIDKKWTRPGLDVPDRTDKLLDTKVRFSQHRALMEEWLKAQTPRHPHVDSG